MTTQPEAVRWATASWWTALAINAAHQILGGVIAFFNRGQLMAELEKRMNGQAVPEMAASIGVVMSVLFLLGFLGLFAWFVAAFRQGGRFAQLCRKTMTFVSIYLGISVITVFAIVPTSLSIPQGWFLADGCLSIACGVAAIIGLIFAQKKESLEWGVIRD